MNPHDLVSPASPIGYPAPFWFLELFKVLGFCLHVMPMNLWYAGGIVAVVLVSFGKGSNRMVGRHIARALPFALAFGINFGIIPLLFVQAAYHQFFYTATTLMAWPWFAVFWMVMVAYFGVYLHRLSLENHFSAKLGIASGWIAAGIFVVVGFCFANAMSLMTRVGGWWGIFKNANVSGAATGLAMNFGDPTLIARWLFMFGLAITTTAAFILLDAAFLSERDGEAYRRHAARFGGLLYSIGVLWFIACGSWYIFGTRPNAFPLALSNPVMRIVFPFTAISPVLPWLLIMLQRNGPRRRLAQLTGVAQFLVIALNAASRQWLQNVELSGYANLANHPVDLQSSALVAFLLLFVVGVALVVWMVSKALKAGHGVTRNV